MPVFFTAAAGTVETRCSQLGWWQSRRLRCHPECHCSWPPGPPNDHLLSLTVCSRKNHREWRVPISPTDPFTQSRDAQGISFSAQHHTLCTDLPEGDKGSALVCDRQSNAAQKIPTRPSEPVAVRTDTAKRTLWIWLNKGFKWRDYLGLSREPRLITWLFKSGRGYKWGQDAEHISTPWGWDIEASSQDWEISPVP